jgi:small subunit ribosomal protein S6e
LANFKLTVSDVKGKSVTKEVKDADANSLLGLQVGSELDAAIVGLSGKLKITGGSDKSGVPMRSDFHSPARKYILLTKGVGLQDTEKGLRKRKLVRGNTISDEIFQVNCRLDGEIKTEEAPKEEAPKEEAKAPKKEAPKKEAKAPKKEAPKKEAKAPKKEAPKEEAKAPKKEESK